MVTKQRRRSPECWKIDNSWVSSSRSLAFVKKWVYNSKNRKQAEVFRKSRKRERDEAVFTMEKVVICHYFLLGRQYRAFAEYAGLKSRKYDHPGKMPERRNDSAFGAGRNFLYGERDV